MGKNILIILSAVIFFVMLLFFMRLILPSEIDDVSPGMYCDEKYLEKADVLWVIPEYNETLISENLKWCEKILSLNKTIGLHGVKHEYQEFLTDRDFNYLNQGVEDFEKCFSYKPAMFKPPQLKISENNIKIVEGENLIIKNELNQFTHRVYHCDDSQARFPNWFIRIF